LYLNKNSTKFCILVEAVELARDLLNTSPSPSVYLYTADHHIIPWYQTTDRHDNATTCKMVCDIVSEILFSHPTTSIFICWVPGSASFNPLKCLQEIATDAATTLDLDLQPLALTITALQDNAWHQSLSNWEHVWLENPQCDPAF
jgi:hypothetical protein